MNEEKLFAITLYVPDATLRALNEGCALRGLILDGVPELDFLPPPWWEGSHTARLGVIPAQEPQTQCDLASVAENVVSFSVSRPTPNPSQEGNYASAPDFGSPPSEGFGGGSWAQRGEPKKASSQNLVGE